MNLCLQSYLRNATFLCQSDDTVGKFRLWKTFEDIYQLLETKNDKVIVYRKLHYLSGSPMEKLDIGVCEMKLLLNTKFQGCQHRYIVKNVLNITIVWIFYDVLKKSFLVGQRRKNNITKVSFNFILNKINFITIYFKQIDIFIKSCFYVILF